MNVDIKDVLGPISQLIRGHIESESVTPMRLPMSPEQLHAELDLSLCDESRPIQEVAELLGAIMAVTPSTASDRFFNQLFAGRDGAAVLGDVLASTLNNSMYTYKAAGVQILLENELIERMGRMVGYDAHAGTFVPGGSLSNLCGMLLARNAVRAGGREDGLSGPPLRIYSSVESHYSVKKAAGILGIGRANVVGIAADRRGRMRPRALREAIRRDRAAGMLPTMINATACTTVLGAFDPLDAIADVAQEEGVWMHTDAAYGGAMLFHPELKSALAGIERSDSVTWDAHKMMGVPLVCSVILVRERGLLTESLKETASYLFQGDSDALNPGTRSLQCGRRNNALKLWTAWKTHGDSGYTQRLQRLRALTLYARDVVAADLTMTLVREPESLNLCFSVDGVAADELCRALNANGEAMVGHAIVDGAPVVRQVFLNPVVSEDAIDHFFTILRRGAAALR